MTASSCAFCSVRSGTAPVLRQPFVARQVGLGELEFAFGLTQLRGRQIDGGDRGADLSLDLVTRPQIEEWRLGRLDHRDDGLVLDHRVADVEGRSQHTADDRRRDRIDLLDARAAFFLDDYRHRPPGDRRDVDTDRLAAAARSTSAATDGGHTGGDPGPLLAD